MSSLRLFVGLAVSLETIDALSGAAESLARRAQQAKRPVRWLPPATYHLTLKFLGATRPETLAAIGDGLRAAARGVEPFRFTTARLGAFPTAQRATVVWAGVDDAAGKVAALAARVEKEMVAIGFLREDRRFHPHVTIGRLREASEVSDVILPLAEQVFSETRVLELILYESTGKSEGSEYAPKLRVPLGG